MLDNISKLCFLLIILIIIFTSMDLGKSQSSIQPLSLPVNNNFKVNKIENISNNKIIIVGDSRFEYMLFDEQKGKMNIPNGIHIIAKSGAGFSWFKDTGFKELEEYLNTSNKDYIYHVIFNGGVNDITYNENYKDVVYQYIAEYENMIEKYPNVKFYLLSINPIIEEKINEREPDNKRTTEKVLEFNRILKKFVISSNYNNINYCDAYNNVEFEIPDGIHYSTETNKRILSYIANKCVVYNDKNEVL